MTTRQHKRLADSQKWQRLSLFEQLGNISSEVNRAGRYQNKDKKASQGAFERGLELFDLTLADPRWRHRLKEIARGRELFCAAFKGITDYNITLADLDKYFYYFALAARVKR